MKRSLNPLQAFNAMTKFLDFYFPKFPSGSLAVLLGGMQFLEDNETADPAYWSDWKKIIGSRKKLSSLEGYNAMIEFLKINLVMETDEITTPQPTRKEVDQELQEMRQFFLKLKPKKNDGVEQETWTNWTKCVEEALNEPEGTKEYLALYK